MSDKSPKPKKKLGQNFLTSPYYAKKIASLIKTSDDSKVIEIGPGTGAVSKYLKDAYPRFNLIEMDHDVIPILKKNLGQGKWTLHVDNILNFDLKQLGSPLHIVGNLPYNIAAMIIKKTLLNYPDTASITFMVQREVAERIIAKPHTKQNSFLSVFCQFFGTPKIEFHLPPGVFFPKPNVQSSIFQLFCNSTAIESLPREEWKIFFDFVSRGFSKRRKTLANALSWNTDSKSLYEKCITIHIKNPKARPEDLSVQNWLDLFHSVKDLIR
jgi:16S rRNA (adenine1518-N6/adenine1519-N6)-dimethyltransferase